MLTATTTMAGKKNLRDNIITELTGRGYINENGSLANKWQECTARMGSSELEGWSQDVAESLNPLVDTLYKDFNNAMDQVQRTLVRIFSFSLLYFKREKLICDGWNPEGFAVR